MKIERVIIVDAPIDRVWNIVGEDFTNIGAWSAAVPSSKILEGDAIDGAPAAGRTCAVAVPGFDYLEETIIDFNAGEKSFTFRVDEGLPGFVTTGISDWKLTAESDDRTRVHVESTLETKGIIGAVMGPMLKLNLKRTLKTLDRDLRSIAETGEPSDVKKKQLAKL